MKASTVKRFFLLMLLGLLVAGATQCGKADPGFVRVMNPGVTLQLKSGRRTHTVSSTGGRVSLPSGTYTPVGITVSQEDTSAPGGRSGVWTLRSYGPFGELGHIKVKPGETTAVDAGPPFTLKTESVQRGSVVYLSLAVYGACGEEYSPGVIVDGRVQSPPRFSIIDETGKTVHTGSFEYG